MGDASKPIKPGWLHGVAVDFSRRQSLLLFVFLAVVSVCLCYSQFGIMSWGDELAGSLNIILFLIPVALCVVLLGVVPGVGLAFITGALLMLRAQWTPTSLFDFQMADPLLLIPSITLGAMLMAAIVTPSARRWPADLSHDVSIGHRLKPIRIASIVIGCFAFAFVFSYASRGLVYLLVTPGGTEYNYSSMVQTYLDSLSTPFVFLEACVNGVILSMACIITVIANANRRSGARKPSLNASFARWLGLAMLFVFLVASSVAFCVETVRATNEANEQIMSELEYLKQQVAEHEKANESVESVAEGFTTVLGGEVVIIRDQAVVSSNDPRNLNKSAAEYLSSGNIENYDFLVGLAADNMLTGIDEERGGFYGLRAIIDEDYTYIAAEPLSHMYRARTATIMYNAVFFLTIQIVVFLVVGFLLKRVIVGPIHRTNNTLHRITEGELSYRVNERNVAEFDELSTGINTTVVSLKDMMNEVEQRNTQDLAAAKTIQESALPREFPPFPDIDRFDIYASMKTAKEVGGDFYDFFLIDDDKLGFLIADVAGKGIPAALFMMASKTQIKNYLSVGMPVNEAVDAANHQLCLGNDAGMFVTMFACVLDYRSGLLSYVNAGHNPPLLHHDGKWEWMRDVSGMPLGLFDGLPYDRFEFQLEPADTLYLYTDGVTEAMDKDGDLFGDDRLLETLEHYTGLNARSISVGVRRAITDFTLDAEQSDDITMLTMRYGVPPEAHASMELPADVKQLVHVYNFIHEELHRRGAPQSVYNPLDIAAEELFVNVCHYAYPDATPENPGEVRIGFEYEASPPSLTVTITDDGIPYNPLAKPDAVTPDDIMEVPIGGLGILMAKNSVDDMTYERIGNSNVLSFRKSW